MRQDVHPPLLPEEALEDPREGRAGHVRQRRGGVNISPLCTLSTISSPTRPPLFGLVHRRRLQAKRDGLARLVSPALHPSSKPRLHVHTALPPRARLLHGCRSTEPPTDSSPLTLPPHRVPSAPSGPLLLKANAFLSCYYVLESCQPKSKGLSSNKYIDLIV